MNKIIVIEGTDCSGKETQSKLLIEKLKQDLIDVEYIDFPNYNSPTGKIIAGPYLGKEDVDEKGNRLFYKPLFSEGASNVNPKVSSLYYAADRLYNMEKITKTLETKNIILDRYSYSNMAHQGGKILDQKERGKMYKWVDELEFGLLKLPHADIKIFLHMPYEYVCELKKNRQNLDQNEIDESYLKNSEKAYLEIASNYDFKTIECVCNNNIRTIEDISEELYHYVKSKLK